MNRCYDCGGVENHHTPKCELADEGAIRDLPEVPGTQWWDREAKQPSPELQRAAEQDLREQLRRIMKA